MDYNGKTGMIPILRRIVAAASNFRGATLLMIIIVIFIIMMFTSPAFLTSANLKTTAMGFSADGIVVIGMTLALVSGGVDLSVGSVFMLAGVVTGKLWLLGVNVWIAVLGGLFVGLLCGLFVGIWVGRLGINPLITSLAMMGMARGAGYIITQGTPLSLYRMPKEFTSLGSDVFLGLPIFVVFFLVITVVFHFLTNRANVFRKIFYIGSNENAAVLSGINVAKVKVGVYTMVAALSSIAGILTIARFRVDTPSVGGGMELAAIAAAVIGGCSLRGGEGSVIGSVLGILLLALIRNAMVLHYVSVYWQAFVAGFILVVAVTIDQLGQRRRMKKKTAV